MSPTKLPTPSAGRFRMPRPLFRNPLTAAAAISFSLTFVGAGVALLLGYLPQATRLGTTDIDTGVVLLVVPLCALLLAIIVEVTRSTLRETVHDTRPRTNPLGAWKPGHGEG